jgi:hypothetical protein
VQDLVEPGHPPVVSHMVAADTRAAPPDYRMSQLSPKR